MNLYAYAGNNPIAFSDPFGLAEECPDGKSICASSGSALGDALKRTLSNAIDKVVGTATAALDAIRGQEPGTTTAAVADAALNPPDLSNISTSGSLTVGPLTVTGSAEGLDAYLSPGLALTLTADVTYKTGADQSGPQLAVGGTAGEGVVGGLSTTWNTSGRMTNVTASFGVGVGAKTADKLNLKGAAKTAMSLFEHIGIGGTVASP